MRDVLYPEDPFYAIHANSKVPCVICGRLDGYWEHTVNSWDLAAGVLTVTEAGGQVSAVDGGPFDIESGQVLASNRSIHAAMSEVLAGS